MRTWAIVLIRLMGGVLSLGIILGFAWSAGDNSWLELAPPLLLFALSIAPAATIRKYWIPVVVILVASIVSMLLSGIPFVNTNVERDVDLMFGAQWALIVFFLWRAWVGSTRQISDFLRSFRL
jgi:hypothetical protein